MIQNATPDSGELVSVPIHQIHSTTQIRTRNGFDEESLQELASTIKQHGLLQPLVVTRTGDESYTLIAGERRLLACSLANLAEVPVLVRSGLTAEDAAAMPAIENLQRVELTLLDRADGVQAMVQKIGAKRTGQMLGKSSAWISKHVSVARLPADVRALASEGATDDPEVLNCMKQIRGLSVEVFASLCERLHSGDADRATVRAVLENLKKPLAAQEKQRDESEGDDSGEGEKGEDETPRSSTAGMVPLNGMALRSLMQALDLQMKIQPETVQRLVSLKAHLAKYAEKAKA